MSLRSRQLQAIREDLHTIAVNTATIASTPEPGVALAGDQHFHTVEFGERGLELLARIEHDADDGRIITGFRRTLDSEPFARLAVIAVANRLRAKADAEEPLTMAQIRACEEEYVAIQRLFAVIGETTSEERDAADDILASLLAK